MTERLQPRCSHDLPEGSTRDVMARVEQAGKDVHMLRLFANSPNVFRPYVTMSNALMHRSALPERMRELAILCLAQRMRTDYEWWEHLRMGAEAGLTRVEIAAIHAGRLDDVGSDDAERFVVRATDEWLASSGRLSDSTWAAGIEALGEDALVDLAFTWAWWGAWVPAVARTFDIRIPTGDQIIW